MDAKEIDQLAMTALTNPEQIQERIKLGLMDFKMVTMASLTSASIAARYFDKGLSDMLYRMTCELIRRYPEIEEEGGGPPPPLMRD